MQGFASGDTERDGAAIQRFLAKGLPMALSQSYAKNMGMYGQRIGAFSIVCADDKQAAAVESQVKAVARAMYSNPPCHGAYLVHTILSDPELKAQWYVFCNTAQAPCQGMHLLAQSCSPS